MKEALERIDSWLGEHASGILDALQGPATPEKLSELQSMVKGELPEDLMIWFQVHNGFSPEKYANYALGLPYLSLERTIDRHAKMETAAYDETMRYFDEGVAPSFNSSAEKIEIANDNSACQLYVDLAPTASGSYGQIVLFDADYQVALRVADSLRSLFNSFESDLYAGRYQLLPEALEDGVHWLQPDAELDVINWFRQPKWASILKNHA